MAVRITTDRIRDLESDLVSSHEHKDLAALGDRLGERGWMLGR